MGIDFYYLPGSPPCRAVYLAAKQMGVELNFKLTNIMAGENRTPEFLEMNPQHTIPTLDDNGFIMNESRAMLQYLGNKYCDNDSLYPADPEKRAAIDQRLFFDIGTLYARLGETYFPIIFANQSLDLDKVKRVDEALGWLEEYIGDGYVAGDDLSIADFAVMASLSTLEVFSHELSNFSNVVAYMEKCKNEMEGYNDEMHQQGLESLRGMMKTALENV